MSKLTAEHSKTASELADVLARSVDSMLGRYRLIERMIAFLTSNVYWKSNDIFVSL